MTSCEKTITVTGHLSVIVATIAEVGITLSRGTPVYVGVILWALLAVADGIKKWVERQKRMTV